MPEVHNSVGSNPTTDTNKLALSPCPSHFDELGRRNKKVSCNWPKCNCPLSKISGQFHQEKIEWIVREKIKDPSFKIPKIRIF